MPCPMEPRSRDVVNVHEGAIAAKLARPARVRYARRMNQACVSLEEVLTDEAFEHMIEMGAKFERGVQDVIDNSGLAWTVTRLGCRAEYMLGAERPKSGQEASDAFDTELDALLHLYMLNRGILMTPFHMMALMCPVTSSDDVDAHTRVLAEAAAELTS